jgi:hypothetical protein
MLDNFSAIPRLDLLKVDVEGMEADVIRGGRQLLQKFKPTLYLENDRIDKSKDLIELVSSLGYRLFWHMPPFFNPANNKGDAENVFATIVSVNMLCLHRDLVSNVSGMTEIVDSSFHPMKR